MVKEVQELNHCKTPKNNFCREKRQQDHGQLTENLPNERWECLTPVGSTSQFEIFHDYWHI
jgi:hypothetical protein